MAAVLRQTSASMLLMTLARESFISARSPIALANMTQSRTQVAAAFDPHPRRFPPSAIKAATSSHEMTLNTATRVHYRISLHPFGSQLHVHPFARAVITWLGPRRFAINPRPIITVVRTPFPPMRSTISPRRIMSVSSGISMGMIRRTMKTIVAACSG